MTAHGCARCDQPAAGIAYYRRRDGVDRPEPLCADHAGSMTTWGHAHVARAPDGTLEVVAWMPLGAARG